jgi:hypothetical protein
MQVSSLETETVKEMMNGKTYLQPMCVPKNSSLDLDLAYVERCCKKGTEVYKDCRIYRRLI